MKFLRKYSIATIILFIGIFSSVYLFMENEKTKNKIVTRVKEEIVAKEFVKMKSNVEFFFKLAYQTIRTISLLPSVQSITGDNLRSEDEDIIKDQRFTEEGQQTVQQLYNNLTSNIRVSEIYAIVKGFNHKKGEKPFFMYDSLVLKTQKGQEVNDVKGSDFPEESEEEEYDFYPTQISFFEQNYPKNHYQNSLDSIPAIVSHPMRTCDNTQYISKNSGNSRDAEGLLYSVPFYNNDGEFNGIISAIFRTNALEALLLNVPSLLITPEDIKTFKEMDISFPAKNSSFHLVNRDKNIFIKDRRSKSVLDYRKYISMGNAKDGNVFFEKVDIKSESPWYLFYDFSYLPWKDEINKTTTLLFVKLFAIFLLIIGAFIVTYAKSSGISKIAQEIIEQLADLSNNLLNISSEITKSSDSIVKHTSSQAASIEQTFASMEEVNTMIKSNSDMSKEVVALSKEVNSVSKDGNKSMDQLVSSMNEISKSNSDIQNLVKIIGQIGEKTKIIDEIVFQTKLLSFNASVEAERAGEHGRGFAVVAQEVGNLAHMSGKSATEISQIVKDSVGQAGIITEQNKQKVDAGNEYVNKTALLLKKINTNSTTVSDNILHMAKSSQEQSQGLDEVSKAMFNIDKATQEFSDIAISSQKLGAELRKQINDQNEIVLKLGKLLHKS